MAAGDIDRDGDLDLVVTHVNQPVSLLRNESSDSNNWISVQLTGTLSARNPVGASIVLETNSGQRLLRLHKSGGSYASSSDRPVHFGIGSHEISRMTVMWPSGHKQTFQNIAVNQSVAVVEGRDSLTAIP